MKRIYGVIGDPIEHSLSPVMQNAAIEEMKMDSIYLAFRVKAEEVKTAVLGAKSLGISGLNVTVPHKQRVMEFLELDSLARDIGAVNTIDFSTNTGYNTDGVGVKRALEGHGVAVKSKSVLLLGAGGAARAIAFQLEHEGAEITIANRTEKKAIVLADSINGNVTGMGLGELSKIVKDSDILINSTSVGMFPDLENSLVTSDLMHPDLVVFDIVYNPVETRLLREAKKAGSRTIDGVMMLVHQGAESFKIWTGREAPLDVMEKAVRGALKMTLRR
ncbi:MAG: shikimate dehydrogenase [Halobacteriota archaeon]|nr:shikimate dehydrogenase [Halobacteriota archaeon]